MFHSIMLRSDFDGSLLQGKRKLGDKATTLIKEKHSKRRGEMKTICDRDTQTPGQDRQTQCAPRDGGEDVPRSRDVVCGLNKPEVGSRDVPSQFESSPVQTTRRYHGDYNYRDQREYTCPCNEHTKRDGCRTKTIYASEATKIRFEI